ncbi:MAG: hypothetical protein JJ902_06230 [Roseibium sp.]|nr:hypothetical protein [Roseibium sp.]
MAWLGVGWEKSHLKRYTLPLLAAVMIAGGAIPAAQACEGDEVLFEDSFDDNLCNWPCNPDRGGISEGVFIIKPTAGKSYSSILPTFFFKDADICLDMEFAEGEDVEAGLLFWAEDYDNYFQFLIRTNDKFEIYRLKNDEWTKIAIESTGTAIKPGLDVSNRLRVTLKGNLATFYVNGNEVHKMRGQKPSGETKIGLYVGGASDTRSARFTEIKVTDVQ